ERCRLRRGHPAPVDGHGERRHLIVGNLSGGEAFDEVPNLARRQFVAITLFRDEEDGIHADSPRIDNEKACHSHAVNRRLLSFYKCGREDLTLPPIARTRPSTWRVCQFRHERVEGIW